MLGKPVLRPVAGHGASRVRGRGRPRLHDNASRSTQVCADQIRASSSLREESMLERTRVQSPFYTAEHEAFRDVMRRFVAREIEPYASEWDEAGGCPRSPYVKADES